MIPHTLGRDHAGRPEVGEPRATWRSICSRATFSALAGAPHMTALERTPGDHLREVKARSRTSSRTPARAGTFILVDAEDRENEGDVIIPAQFATPDADQLHGQARPRPDLPGDHRASGSRSCACRRWRSDNQLAPRHGLHRLDRGARGRHHRHLGRRPRAHRRRGDRPAQGPTTSSRPATSSRWWPATAACWSAPATPRRPSTSARLAGLNPAGVICEIMNDDGTMARLPDLVAFAQLHGLKIGTIADLIAYRRRNDSIVRRLSETTFESIYGGDFRCVIYVNKVTLAQHLALVKGDPATGGRSRAHACGQHLHRRARPARHRARRRDRSLDALHRHGGSRRRRADSREAPTDQAVGAASPRRSDRARRRRACATTASAPRS